jgi:hypothetical protein
MGLPVTRENYLNVAFLGNPPEEPLDGGLEAELPEELQQWDELSVTPEDFPLCAACSKSTGDMGALVCSPCMNRTKLVLSTADRRWLRAMGISRH